MTFRRTTAALVLVLGIALLYSPQLRRAGGCAGTVDDAALADADQSGSHRAHEQRQGADRGRVGQRRDRDELPGRRLGSAGRNDHHAVARRGTCSATAWSSLPDGRVFINGGNLQYDPFHGQPRNAVFDPATGTLHRRRRTWRTAAGIRPSTTLGDGRVMTFSGLEAKPAGRTRRSRSTRRASGWSPEYPAGWTPPLYPRMHLLPDGTRLLLGLGHGLADLQSRRRKTWSAVVATTNYTGTRTYGTSVLLPLTPANGYTPRVMIFGGGNPATATTEIIDLSAPHAAVAVRAADVAAAHRDERDDPAERQGAGDRRIGQRRRRRDREPERRPLRSGTNTFTLRGRERVSAPLSLGLAAAAGRDGAARRRQPDARHATKQHMEIYSPAYLFNADGTPALRPTITDVSRPARSATAARSRCRRRTRPTSRSVVLVRPGAPTHAFDMDQRLVGAVVHGRQRRAERHGAAERQHRAARLLHAVHPELGRRAVGRQLRAAARPRSQSAADRHIRARPPTSRSTRASRSPSRAPQRSGRHHQQLRLDLPWRQPGPSALLEPGNVTYSSPGTYVASFKVTDNGGPRAHRPRAPSRCPTSRSRPRRPLERFCPEPHELLPRRSRHQRIHRLGCTQRQRAARGCHRFVQSRIHRRLRFVHAQRGHQRDDGRWNLSADDHRNDPGDHPHRDRQPRGGVVGGPPAESESISPAALPSQ